MVFWRKKNNIKEQEQEEKDEQLLHPNGEPEICPNLDDAKEVNERDVHEAEQEIHSAISDEKDTPVPNHTPLDDAQESEELRDHSDEGGWFSRLTSGLSKSSRKISDGLNTLLVKRKLDQETLDQLEDLLIAADLGPLTAAKITEELAKDKFEKEVSEQELKEILAEKIAAILEPVAKTLEIPKQDDPFVILMTGVNGVGKTTTIGKFAHNYHMKDKRSVLLAAGDTFRAAAVEQLQIWAERTHSQFFGKDLGADAAAVAYESYEKAKSENTEILMIDTAGRLHNKANLMQELEKIVRVLKKHDENTPHETLLVLDATTGQNAIAQVETFKEIANITGLIVTKLDGSARGGIVISLADKFGLPIYAVGVGEKAEDLQPFHAHEFAKGLVGLISE